MPGTFDTLFDDEPMGAFGGYRPQFQNVVAKLADNRTSPGQVTPVTDTAAAPAADSDAAPSVLAYPNGSPVLDDQGHPYLRPPGLDMQKNLAIGQDIAEKAEQFLPTGEPPLDRDAMFAPHFIPGGDMDYKRPVGTFGSREMQFRPATYYNYGAMAAKAGYGEEEALWNAGLYNRYFGGTYLGANGVNTLLGHPPKLKNPYGLDGDDAEAYIRQGYEDYANGRWTPNPSN